MQVVVNGLLTTYQTTGSNGPWLVLVHGWGDTQQTYDKLVASLGKGHRIVRLDLPGFGTTEPPKTTWGLQDYAQFLTDFLTKLSIKPAVVAGHSNGGAVVIKAIAAGLIKPSHLVLLASAGIRDRQSGRKRVYKLIAKVGKALTFWLPRKTRQTLQRKLYGTIGSDYLVAPHLQETFKRTVAEDITNDAQIVQTPTLLIYGSNDAATPVNDIGVPLSRAIAGSRLETIDGADHFVHQQKPDQVATLILEFIAT